MVDPARHLVPRNALAAHNDRVASVVSALESDHVAEVCAQDVNQLALALVPPLQTENGKVSRMSSHRAPPLAELYQFPVSGFQFLEENLRQMRLLVTRQSRRP
jgi:hypothetical protein